jgi:hypothetical protein
MKWNAFVFLRLCNLKSFLYYRMVKALPFMLGKALGKPGKTPNIIPVVKSLPLMLGKVPGEPGDMSNIRNSETPAIYVAQGAR